VGTPVSVSAIRDGEPASSGTHAETSRLAQKAQDAVSVFFARKVSPYFTPVFLRFGISANQATALWGLISLGNTFVIYLALTGRYVAIPFVFALFFVVVVFDCVDGEIARSRGTASPIGGKLLDGVWHKATEYALLIVYVAGAFYWRNSLLLMPIGLILLAGEAMYTYVYERRLTVIRVFAKSSEYINPTSADDLYRRDERWRDFPRRKKVNAFKGLVQYKSVYFMIGLSYLSADMLFAGVVVLMIYKHYSWIKLLVRTVNRPPQLASQ
jgi:phosphatidylglycerophosphate synthase